MLLLDKEGVLGIHQTSHNPGVIQSGIYYARAAPGRDGLNNQIEISSTFLVCGACAASCGRPFAARPAGRSGPR